jgi:hypothetical protein
MEITYGFCKWNAHDDFNHLQVTTLKEKTILRRRLQTASEKATSSCIASYEDEVLKPTYGRSLLLSERISKKDLMPQSSSSISSSTK